MATEWLAAREAAGTRTSVFWYRPQHSAVKLDDRERGDIWTRELGEWEQYGTELASAGREATVRRSRFSRREVKESAAWWTGAASLKNEPSAFRFAGDAAAKGGSAR